MKYAINTNLNLFSIFCTTCIVVVAMIYNVKTAYIYGKTKLSLDGTELQYSQKNRKHSETNT